MVFVIDFVHFTWNGSVFAELREKYDKYERVDKSRKIWECFYFIFLQLVKAKNLYLYVSFTVLILLLSNIMHKNVRSVGSASARKGILMVLPS